MKKTFQKYSPWPYQQEAFEFLLDHEEAGLFLDMGLGKTVITLTAMKALDWDWSKALVIAPKRPAIDTWPEELNKWEHLRSWPVTYKVAVGSASERQSAVDALADITIINRENVQWLVDYWKTRWPYDFIVIDELSSFKSSRSKRFRSLKKVRKKVKRIWGLTGTPAGNGYMDLWAECYLLDGGKALGKTITGYREAYFYPGRRNGNIIYEWVLRKGSEDLILEKVKPFCISMKTEDYIDLPEFTTIEKRFTLSPKAKAAYKMMEKDKLLEVDEEEIDAVNAAVLTGKLLQISTGEIYAEDKQVIEIHEDKLDTMQSLVEELACDNALVFYQYRHERDRLMKAFPEAVDIQEDGAIQRWKAGKIKMLLAHPQSAGHGLNLQSGGSVIIWYSLPMSLELYQQACKRLHRQGQKEKVRNYVLMGKGTYEEIVFDQILKNKEKRQDALLAALKSHIKEVKNAN